MGKTKPSHVGPLVLPNFPLFLRLAGHASNSNTTAIDDRTNDIQANHLQLLTDCLHVRNTLLASLSEEVQEQLWQGEEVYFILLAPGSYEYAVAFLAILAVGGIVVPISPALPEKEALYYIGKCNSSIMLTAKSCTARGSRIVKAITAAAGGSSSSFTSLDILPFVLRPPLSAGSIVISNDHILDYHGTGLVIFTSGTTNLPKGAARSRSSLDGQILRITDLYQLGCSDRVLHTLPVHHATGIQTTFLPFLVAGSCVEFHSDGFDPARVWEIWRSKRITYFSGVPTMYMRMMTYYETVLKQRPLAELAQYEQGARHLKQLLCGTSALARSLAHKWTALTGKRILERYGSTEFSGAFTISPGDLSCPDGSVGKAMAGQDVKLSEGDQGEILIKSPFMFSKYIFDENATSNAFDGDGYFKSGDIARKEGDYYFILGRASVDIIKSGGYKISALDIERELLDLPYVSEAMVVGVEDEEFGQRVAAALVLNPHVQSSLDIVSLRDDLSLRLARYKLPTMLRVVAALQKTVTGKVVKILLSKQLFLPNGHPDIQIWSGKRGVAKL